MRLGEGRQGRLSIQTDQRGHGRRTEGLARCHATRCRDDDQR
jgi:hypothetical protein